MRLLEDQQALEDLLAALAASWARDLAYQVHAIIIMAVTAGMFVWSVRSADEERPPEPSGYMDGVIRYGVIATAFWGLAGFLVGTWIAFQLAFPALNFEFLQGFGNFGRMRPLHTSAVIFAFGGNALIATSFYIVQRTCAARLWGGNLAWFVFWGYNLFIVLAARYHIGIQRVFSVAGVLALIAIASGLRTWNAPPGRPRCVFKRPSSQTDVNPSGAVGAGNA